MPGPTKVNADRFDTCLWRAEVDVARRSVTAAFSDEWLSGERVAATVARPRGHDDQPDDADSDRQAVAGDE